MRNKDMNYFFYLQEFNVFLVVWGFCNYYIGAIRHTAALRS